MASQATTLLLAVSAFIPCIALSAELHVAKTGRDTNRGNRSAPLLTIQRAAELSQPGDVITVHGGVYRERVNPPIGGISDKERIVYQAAPGETVEIKGSEVITNWTRVQADVWKVTLPNSFFGDFNPYKDSLKGDWFNPKGRPHHTGAVYLNGHWLVEAATLEEVMAPAGTMPAWLGAGGEGYLLNVAWLRPQTRQGVRTSAAKFSSMHGVQTAPTSEGGECIGWIDAGDWARYDGIDLGMETRQLEFRVASAVSGGIIQVRLDGPEGELLGSCVVPGTGDWQSWRSVSASIKPTGGVRTLCLVFQSRRAAVRGDQWAGLQLWFAKVEQDNTTIWAQFKGVNPTRELTEINVRQTVFYPDSPGRNFITVRGFVMRHAATPWAPPTAEQIGLIGTHWSKGWIIENNVISHSICSGIALGKHGDRFDNTSADTAEGYVKTIERAHAFPISWTRENIGHHIVRNNTVSHCEQAGIVGSMGCAFSTVTGNMIHDIHVRRLFTGAEMAGIKFHGAIDTVISGNHITRTCLGLWLDWMTQGTRVSRNLFNENDRDLFVEVNHGPFLVDNNLFLSGASLLDMSEGGAYVHNLFNGSISSRPEPGRETPFHPEHSTKVAGLATTKGGDNRFYNNIFVGRGEQKETAAFGLAMYNAREYPLYTSGNVFYNGAQPYKNEEKQLVVNADPQVRLAAEDGQLMVMMSTGPELKRVSTQLVTTYTLGEAKVPQAAYEKADGSDIAVDTDFLGRKRLNNPTPGPFEKVEPTGIRLK